MEVKVAWLVNRLKFSKNSCQRLRGIREYIIKTKSYTFIAVFCKKLPGWVESGGHYISTLYSSFKWPNDCCLCHEPDANGGVCKACSALIAANSRSCCYCACPLAATETCSLDGLSLSGMHGSVREPASRSICESCTIQPPFYNSAVVPCLYRFPADQLVLQLKYHDSSGVAHAMAQLMADAVIDQLSRSNGLPDFLVPVPLLPARFRERGFNQSMQLCSSLSRRLKIPVHATALTRPASPGNTESRSQTGLDREARLSADHMSFFAGDVFGLRLLLVDDVMTTGATFDKAAASLLNAGARSVMVCAFARTPP